jgi:hypothetical protein
MACVFFLLLMVMVMLWAMDRKPSVGVVGFWLRIEARTHRTRALYAV